MRRRRLAAVFAVPLAAAVTTLSCSKAAPPDPESEGAKLYVANCAECHGQDAGGLKGPNLRGGLGADFVAATVAGGHAGVPPFTDKMSAADIATLADYIHSIGNPG